MRRAMCMLWRASRCGLLRCAPLTGAALGRACLLCMRMHQPQYASSAVCIKRRSIPVRMPGSMHVGQASRLLLYQIKI